MRRDLTQSPGVSDFSIASVEAIDQDIRARLADSLAYVCETAGALLVSPGLEVTSCLEEIRAHRVHPGVFARYYDLVFAYQVKSYDSGRQILREIVELSAECPSRSVLPFTASALGDDMARYGRLVDLSNPVPGMLAPPRSETWSSFADNVSAAWDLIGDVDPVLAAEVGSLIIHVVGAVPPDGTNVRFRGVSSLMLWGAVVVNADFNKTALQCAETLVHEAAHELLFGLSRDEPLVLNAIDENFASPLRKEPRPMDGVFHAMFVCARIHYFYSKLKASRILSAADRPMVDDELATFAHRFREGFDTVRQHARLTETGERILSTASAYMAKAA